MSGRQAGRCRKPVDLVSSRLRRVEDGAHDFSTAIRTVRPAARDLRPWASATGEGRARCGPARSRTLATRYDRRGSSEVADKQDNDRNSHLTYLPGRFARPAAGDPTKRSAIRRSTMTAPTIRASKLNRASRKNAPRHRKAAETIGIRRQAATATSTKDLHNLAERFLERAEFWDRLFEPHLEKEQPREPEAMPAQPGASVELVTALSVFLPLLTGPEPKAGRFARGRRGWRCRDHRRKAVQNLGVELLLRRAGHDRHRPVPRLRSQRQDREGPAVVAQFANTNRCRRTPAAVIF